VVIVRMFMILYLFFLNNCRLAAGRCWW